MPLQRSHEDHEDHNILPYRHSGEVLPSFPSEKLDGFTAEKLQALGTTALEHLCRYLHIPLDDKEVIQTLLKGMDDQDDEARTRLKNNIDAQIAFDSEVLKPQTRALQEMVTQHLTPGTGWEAHVVSGLMHNVFFENKKLDIKFFMYAKGFHLITPQIEVSWDCYSQDETNISFAQSGDQLAQAAPIVAIHHKDESNGGGVLNAYHTNQVEYGVEQKPYFGDLIFPSKVLTHATYTKHGQLRYLTVSAPEAGSDLVPYGQISGEKNTRHFLYDFRENQATEGVLPTLSYANDTEFNEIHDDAPSAPTIHVGSGFLTVMHQGRSDAFPLELTGGVEAVARKGFDALVAQFPLPDDSQSYL